MERFIETCRGKLHMKKKAKRAGLVEGAEVCSILIRNADRNENRVG